MGKKRKELDNKKEFKIHYTNHDSVLNLKNITTSHNPVTNEPNLSQTLLPIRSNTEMPKFPKKEVKSITVEKFQNGIYKGINEKHPSDYLDELQPAVAQLIMHDHLTDTPIENNEQLMIERSIPTISEDSSSSNEESDSTLSYVGKNINSPQDMTPEQVKEWLYNNEEEVEISGPSSDLDDSNKNG
jgi:hypothetical protein